MPRLLRYYALGCVALAMAYLAVHVPEPLRLNHGDPWGDANVVASVEHVQQYGFADSVEADPLRTDTFHPIHFPPIPELFYCVVGSFGVRDIAVFRALALLFSAAALWFLYQWVRRTWSEPIGLIATGLWATSLMWLMFADSVRQVPIEHASGFLALWAVSRGIETERRRYSAIAFIAGSACLLAGYELWIFLPAATLVTVYTKRGNLFRRGNFRFLVLVALALAVAMLVKQLFVSGPIGWQVVADRRLGATFSILGRRYTLLYTPLLWVTVVVTAWRALRAPSWRIALADGTTWLLAVAVVGLVVFVRRASSPMAGAVPLLPLYAIGSATLVARCLDGRWIGRGLAMTWMVVAPLWASYVLLNHPRSVLDRDDVATVNHYLAANDRNDFVISNLLSDGPIETAFERHNSPAKDTVETDEVFRELLDVFEATGTDYVHAIIFTSPDSRFIERSLGQLTASRRLAAIDGWPYLVRRKARSLISEYDKRVVGNLQAAGAKVVLHLATFDVYRLDRASLIEAAGKNLPVTKRVDFGSVFAARHELLGWGKPEVLPEGIAVSRIAGSAPCANPVVDHRPGEPASNACETVMTRRGLRALDEGSADSAQLMIRVEKVCDLKVDVVFGAPALVNVSLNGFSSSQCTRSSRMSFVVPAASVKSGVSVLTFERHERPDDPPTAVASVVVEPRCPP